MKYPQQGFTTKPHDTLSQRAARADSAVQQRFFSADSQQMADWLHAMLRDPYFGECYDSGTGRFISMDEHPGSHNIPLTLNKYLYANADPINHIDPSGYFSLGGVINASVNIAISYARMTLFDLITDMVVSPIVNAFMSRFTGGGMMPGGSISINVIMNSLAFQCAITKKRCLIRKVPLISHGMDVRGHANHIIFSQFGFGNTATGAGVTSSILVRGGGRSKYAWYNRFYPCNTGRVGDGLSCDEYPFASTLNGGKEAYMNDAVSLMLLPGSESKRQGVLLRRFYSFTKVRWDEPFISVANPLVPSYYIDDKGNAHIPFR